MFRHSRSSQNSKFAISLQYLKEEVKDEVDFLREDKYQRFLQVDFSTLGLTLPVVKLSCWSAWSSILKVLKVKSLQYLYNIKREVRDGVYFLHADKHQNFYKLALLFFDGSDKTCPKYPKWKLVIFVQYLKKKLSQLFCSILINSDILWVRGSGHVRYYLLLSFLKT